MPLVGNVTPERPLTGQDASDCAPRPAQRFDGELLIIRLEAGCLRIPAME